MAVDGVDTFEWESKMENSSLRNASSLEIIGTYLQSVSEHFEDSSLTEGFWPSSLYTFSTYGLSCLVMAFILNRTILFGSRVNSIGTGIQSSRSNARKRISRGVLTLLRITVIGVMLYDVYLILVTLKLNSQISLTHADRWWLYDLIPDRSFEYDPEYFGGSIYMASSKELVMIGPTGNVNWLFFMGVCYSVFVETLIASLEGRKPLTECGFTIFELSVCYHSEVGGTMMGRSTVSSHRPMETTLMISLYVILCHFSVHLGALLNGNRYRLIPSSVLSLSFLAYWVSVLSEKRFADFSYIVYPYCVPQVTVIAVILLSAAIAMVAFLANGLTFQDLRYINLIWQDGADDHDFRAQIFNFKWDDDFYSFLINLGEVVVTSATKTSYVSETSLVNLYSSTWLERDILGRIKNASKSSGNNTDSRLVNVDETISIELPDISSGYGNVLVNPPASLMKLNMENGLGDTGSKHTIFRSRLTTSFSLLRKFLELFRGLTSILIGKRSQKFVHSAKKTLASIGILKPPTDDSYEIYVPSFLKGFIKKDTRHTSSQYEVIEPESDVDWDDADYMKLLTGPDLKDVDHSADYEVIVEDDSDLDTDSDLPEPEAPPDADLADLFSPSELIEFVSSTSIEILHNHLSQDQRRRGVVTRARHRSVLAASQPGAIQPSSDDVFKLASMLVQGRPQNTNPSSDTEGSKYDCVVCQVNCREIITWPCKCLAICEQCRISLLAKGLDSCVCCRKKVDGVSKVYVP